MFEREERDKLLFEDDNFTYSRRYFWAFQTLAVMNDEIQAMIAAYKETFTEEVWSGQHKYIWPGNKDQSSRFSNWRKKMANLRKQFDQEIKQLEHVLALNVAEQRDIKSLRDQLFSGTSVRESRVAVKQAQITVQQGFNIKLLTLVSIFFLPLTFVTSIFGMTNMNPNDSFIPFAIVTVAICVPTYFLIGSLNSNRGMKLFQAKTTAMLMKIGWLLAIVLGIFRPNSERSRRYQERYLKKKPSHPPARQRRPSRSLSSYVDVTSRSTRASRTAQRARQAGVQERHLLSFPQPARTDTRESLVRFDLPAFDKPPRRLNGQDDSKAMEELEKNGPSDDPSPLASSPAAEEGEHLNANGGLFRRFTDRINGRAR